MVQSFLVFDLDRACESFFLSHKLRLSPNVIAFLVFSEHRSEVEGRVLNRKQFTSGCLGIVCFKYFARVQDESVSANALLLEVSAQVPVSMVGHVYGALFPRVCTILKLCSPNHQELIILTEQVPRFHLNAPWEALFTILTCAIEFDPLENDIVLSLLELHKFTQFHVFNNQTIPVTSVEAIRTSMQTVCSIVLFKVEGPVIGEPAPWDVFESKVAIRDATSHATTGRPVLMVLGTIKQVLKIRSVEGNFLKLVASIGPVLD